MLSDDTPAAEHGGDTPDQGAEALTAALIELEHHVAEGGWDQPPRLFALVHTDELAAVEPALAAELHLRTSADGAPPDALTAIEQEGFYTDAVRGHGHGRVEDPDDLVGLLDAIEWPATVHGCALAVERTFLPADVEAELPADPAAAAAFVAAHPRREDIRVVVGVDRTGRRHGVARLVSRPDDLLGGPDLVPALSQALAHTLV